MRTMVRDYYAGFEGYGELTFVARDANGDELAFTLWQGYFSGFMEQIKPGPEGWTGLALPYHTLSGWDEDDDWQIPNPEEATRQLESLNPALLSGPEPTILRELVAFLREAITRGDDLRIQYF